MEEEKNTNTSLIEIVNYLKEIDELLKKTDEEEKVIPYIVKAEIDKIIEKEKFSNNDPDILEYEENLIKKYQDLLQKRREKLENAKKQLNIFASTFTKPTSLS
ncbi:MAG: hypothetical protein JXB88_22500 [Spirochaetales bacterium]|nr:hypothetical protein [Spirochaetales bacterium]